MGLTKVFEEGSSEDRPELKIQINKGAFNLQMFHTVKYLYASLDLYSTNIRRPYSIDRETQDVINENSPDRTDPKAWIYERFQGCITAVDASKECDVKRVVADHLGITKIRQVRNIMIELGFQVDCNDGHGRRFVRFNIDRDGVKKPIKIRQ